MVSKGKRPRQRAASNESRKLNTVASNVKKREIASQQQRDQPEHEINLNKKQKRKRDCTGNNNFVVRVEHGGDEDGDREDPVQLDSVPTGGDSEVENELEPQLERGQEEAKPQDETAPGQKPKRKRTRTRKKKGSGKEGDGGTGDGVGSNGQDAADAGQDGSCTGTEEFVAGPSNTVYVEGIPWSCNEDDVRGFFQMCGKIADIKLPTWHDTGRPRGYAHVSFFNTNSVRAAFELDGDDLNGRYLSIKPAQEPSSLRARRTNSNAEQPRGCRTVFVKNLPYDAEEDEVAELVASCGKVASVRLAVWNHTKKLKGFGYIDFVTEKAAGACVRMQESMFIRGRPLVADYETGAPKGSFRRQDGAQIRKTSANAGVGKGAGPKFKTPRT